MTTQSPFRCPVCDGRGKVPFDPAFPKSTLTSGPALWGCRPCGGSGIVWGPPVAPAPPAPPSPLPPVWIDPSPPRPWWDLRTSDPLPAPWVTITCGGVQAVNNPAIGQPAVMRVDCAGNDFALGQVWTGTMQPKPEALAAALRREPPPGWGSA